MRLLKHVNQLFDISVWIWPLVLAWPPVAAGPLDKRNSALHWAPSHSASATLHHVTSGSTPTAAFIQRSVQPRQLSNGAVGGAFVGSVLGFVLVMLLLVCVSAQSRYPSSRGSPPPYSPPRPPTQPRRQRTRHPRGNATGAPADATHEIPSKETQPKNEAKISKWITSGATSLSRNAETGRWQLGRVKPKDPSAIPSISPMNDAAEEGEDDRTNEATDDRRDTDPVAGV